MHFRGCEKQIFGKGQEGKVTIVALILYIPQWVTDSVSLERWQINEPIRRKQRRRDVRMGITHINSFRLFHVFYYPSKARFLCEHRDTRLSILTTWDMWSFLQDKLIILFLFNSTLVIKPLRYADNISIVEGAWPVATRSDNMFSLGFHNHQARTNVRWFWFLPRKTT